MSDTDDDDYSEFNRINDVTYDASQDPDPATWMELDEDERVLLIRAYHQRVDDEMPTDDQRRLHALAHGIAETQIAGNEPPLTRKTLERLVGADISRHDAIHAIGSAIMTHMVAILHEGAEGTREAFEGVLRAIDPGEWS